ncbi:MAG: hypothetical protein R6U70_09030 [Bacillota bacterium]
MSRMRRRSLERIVTAGVTLTFSLVVAVTLAIFIYIVWRGVPGLSWDYLTQMPRDRGLAGGSILQSWEQSGLPSAPHLWRFHWGSCRQSI